MYRKVKKTSFTEIFTWVVLIFIGIMIFANKWLESVTSKLLYKAVVSRKIQAFQQTDEKNRRRIYKEKVYRKILMNPNRTNSESRLYSEGIMVAQFNSLKDDDIVDLIGDLPEGKVSFLNEFKGTYGEEYFQKGKRHGQYTEYYDNGMVFRRAKFYRGLLMENTIYYFDGTIRQVEDLKDALRFVEDTEAGNGKIYYRDGTLMYEWNLTNTLKGGYKKSYNRDGSLVEEKIYDNMGELVEVINHGYRLTDERYMNKKWAK